MDKMSVEIFRAEFETLSHLSDSSEDFINRLEQYIAFHRAQMPLFCPGHTICRLTKSREAGIDIPFSYLGHKYSEAKRIGLDFSMREFSIRPDQCIGDAWLFESDHFEGPPKPVSLAESLVWNATTAPVPFVWKAGNYYLCTDGCHRIYAAYLLNRTLKISYDREYTKIEPLD